MTRIFAIAAGGALGSVLRFWMSALVHQILGRGFPYGTLAVNILGSLLMGFLSFVLLERLSVSPEWRAAILIGFLGSFTTFSTFSMETLNFAASGEQFKALANVLLSVSLCAGAAWAGVLLGRQV